MKDIVIPNQKNLEQLIQKIKQAGKEKFHVLADFDRTLTKAFVEGQKSPTVIAQLRTGEYLTEDYAQKAHKLFDTYHPIEIDPTVPRKEKSAKMHEWWKKHFDLLIKCGLDKKTMQTIVKKRTLKFRQGTLEFIDFLHQNNIPLIIMSAGPGDMISEYLKQEGRLHNNVHIIANLYEFENGKATKVKEPIVHSMNKAEIVVKGYPVYKLVKDRTNVLLLGDGAEDIDMIEGFDYTNLIKVGFLNENVEQNLKVFKQNYNVLLLNDTNMDYINKLLKEIIS